MKITKTLNSDDATRLSILSYDIEGQKILISLLAKEENYNEELFEQNKQEFLELNTEFSILINMMMNKYFSEEEIDLIKQDKNFQVFFDGGFNSTISLLSSENKEEI